MSISDRNTAYLYVECDCRSHDHLLRFYHERGEDDEMGVSIQMSHYLPWWRRAWVALKYLVGADARCHYGDALLDHDARKRVAEFVQAKATETGA